ncbi:hypothetical protein MTR_0039s0180 [Medicago truncatula]|uniref:Uncharacterized protein n=1 Tax=Medicago truncatula TaxID=3880 RepID=A0A072TIV2_MEDTR|nr:hypothetical protein MTR_0039s0180 [Medicago truncatula]
MNSSLVGFWRSFSTHFIIVGHNGQCKRGVKDGGSRRNTGESPAEGLNLPFQPRSSVEFKKMQGINEDVEKDDIDEEFQEEDVDDEFLKDNIEDGLDDEIQEDDIGDEFEVENLEDECQDKLE